MKNLHLRRLGCGLHLLALNLRILHLNARLERQFNKPFISREAVLDNEYELMHKLSKVKTRREAVRNRIRRINLRLMSQFNRREV